MWVAMSPRQVLSKQVGLLAAWFIAMLRSWCDHDAYLVWLWNVPLVLSSMCFPLVVVPADSASGRASVSEESADALAACINDAGLCKERRCLFEPEAALGDSRLPTNQ